VGADFPELRHRVSDDHIGRRPFLKTCFQRLDYTTKDKEATTLLKDYGSAPGSCAKRLGEDFKKSVRIISTPCVLSSLKAQREANY
jgi:hypothetical protein